MHLFVLLLEEGDLGMEELLEFRVGKQDLNEFSVLGLLQLGR